MAKRLKVGSVLKSKEAGQMDYIKIDADVILKKGDTLRLESKKSKIEGIKKAMESGKLTGEVAEKLLEQAENMKEFVRFEIIKLNND